MYKIININNYTKKEYDAWYAVMSEEKRKRVDGFAFEKDKKATVFGDMLARKMLSGPLAKPGTDIVFSVSEKGKPYVKGAHCFFNISHSGDYVFCAVSHREVGADIEVVREHSESVLRRVCTQDELSYVLEKPGEVAVRFTEIWTRKEAYFKCLGTGVTDLKGVNTLSSEISKDMITKRINDYVISVYEKPC